MEQSVDEDIQGSSGDNNVSGASVITVDSTSVASGSSLDDEVDDSNYVVDVDDVNTDVEDVPSSGSHVADPPDAQFSVFHEEASVEADVQMLSENYHSSAVNGTEATDDDTGSQCDSAFCKTTAPENVEENSVSAGDMLSLPTEQSSEKCSNGKEMVSANNTTLESGIAL